jgi:carboxypeptidase D
MKSGILVHSYMLCLLVLRASTVGARRRLPNEVGFNATDFGRHLLGKTVNVPKANSPDDHLVTDLPLLDTTQFTTAHWAGLLPASSKGDKYLFYWLFAPSETISDDTYKNKPDEEIPLIVWLNGGPACSSMDGLWLENGPFRLIQKEDGEWSIDIDDSSWHNTPAYMVYIDQPVGTGIAFTTSGKYPSNDEEVNIDFYYFLQEFLILHADKFLNDAKTAMKRDLYFSGESHAGHYIPSMMNYIQKQNNNAKESSSSPPNVQITLGGAAIGNGWVDPTVQYSAHEVAYGYGMIGRAQERALAEAEKSCQADLAQGQYVSRTCFGLLDKVVDNSQGSGSQYTVSQYDQRKWEHTSQPRDFPPGHKNVEAYLGGWGSISSDYKKVLEAIHSTPSMTSGQRYRECTDPPYNALKHQDGLGVTKDVVDLLNNNVRLLFFNGIHDLICNHVGNEIAVENFAWDHQADYQLAKRYGWKSTSKGQLVGYMKEYENLMYLKVLDSGHMVPMDVPDVSLDMLRSLVFKESFDSYEQTIDRAQQEDDTPANCPVCPDAEECATCPECPAVVPNTEEDDEASDNTEDDEGSETSKELHPPTTITVPFIPMEAWLASALIALVVLGCLCWLCRCCRRKSSPGMAVSQYDVELPKRSYTDQPEEPFEIS